METTFNKASGTAKTKTKRAIQWKQITITWRKLKKDNLWSNPNHEQYRNTPKLYYDNEIKNNKQLYEGNDTLEVLAEDSVELRSRSWELLSSAPFVLRLSRTGILTDVWNAILTFGLSGIATRGRCWRWWWRVWWRWRWVRCSQVPMFTRAGEACWCR